MTERAEDALHELEVRPHAYFATELSRERLLDEPLRSALDWIEARGAHLA